MEFVLGGAPDSERVAILAGSFNPPTIAHMQLVDAARAHADEVLCVLPRVFPHKHYFGATMQQRLEMLRTLGLSVALSEKGLFADIAQEVRVHYPRLKELSFLCGADAAERILTWDYGDPHFAHRMLRHFNLLVAPRGSAFIPQEDFVQHVLPLDIGDDYHAVSSSEVRERVRSNQPWEHLVPPPIVEHVRSIYS
ncbi:MAG: nicotinate-nicotinamide nucleotide adenylyltransferase [Acidobacteriaceae bacterium]|nr:nicotinate-nicotinamide nucleotide adenylyltransferase [Acidobacteriaceae bacterium]